MTVLTALALAVLPTRAAEQPDSALYARYVQLFNTEGNDSAEAFYALSRQVQQFHKKLGQTEEYYNARRIEVRYEADRGHFVDAVKKAEDILSEMRRNEGDMRYADIVYCALGTTCTRRGDHRMAAHYFAQARSRLKPEDGTRYVHATAGLAHAYIVSDPDKALRLNEELGRLLQADSTYKKVYLAHKVQIYFYKNDKPEFLKAVHEYEQLLKSQGAPSFRYGERIIGVMENAMTDKHDAVLRGLGERPDDVSRMDAKIRIYERMGREDLALQEAYKRIEAQDSFNHDLMHENLQELDAERAMRELMEKSARERELWFIIVIALLLVGVGLIVSRYYVRRRFQKQLLAQNERLEEALDQAKEVERMKATFIQHVSHEMRTPMNIINGYSQIIADPTYELDAENRAQLIQAIDQNTTAMTAIINDLLEISNDSSKDRYACDQHIVLKDFCSNIMKKAEAKNKGRLELKFTSAVPDDFAFLSNAQGLDRVLKQLMKNARLNTEQGSIWLDVRLSEDGGALEFTVTDTGPGIALEHQDHIFEQFYKVDQFKPGLGVGLSVALKIAIRLGGSLRLVKGYKGGARFVLTIPVKRP